MSIVRDTKYTDGQTIYIYFMCYAIATFLQHNYYYIEQMLLAASRKSQFIVDCIQFEHIVRLPACKPPAICPREHNHKDKRRHSYYCYCGKTTYSCDQPYGAEQYYYVVRLCCCTIRRSTCGLTVVWRYFNMRIWIWFNAVLFNCFYYSMRLNTPTPAKQYSAQLTHVHLYTPHTIAYPSVSLTMRPRAREHIWHFKKCTHASQPLTPPS